MAPSRSTEEPAGQNSGVANRISGGIHKPAESNSWVGYHGPAGFDFRSDVMTTPTPAMLNAIQHCTLMDDVYREDTTTVELEAHCARLAGKEAGLFVLSGTMGNQLALRALLAQPPYGVLCDNRSHIYRYEAGGLSHLSGAMLRVVAPSNELYLTLEDVQSHADIDDDVHTCPTRVISLENTLNGVVMPLEEVQRISNWARAQSVAGIPVRMHCDGARLWDAVAAGAGSLADFAACFDTVTLCFSKGLGAPVGSVIVGPHDMIERVRWVRKSVGGGLRQAGVLTAAARVAVDETFGKGSNGEGGLLRMSHEFAKEVETLWMDLGGELILPVETNMCWLDLEAAGVTKKRFVEIAQEEGLKMSSNRLVVHYQIAQNREKVVPRLKRLFERVITEGDGRRLEIKGRRTSRYYKTD